MTKMTPISTPTPLPWRDRNEAFPLAGNPQNGIACNAIEDFIRQISTECI